MDVTALRKMMALDRIRHLPREERDRVDTVYRTLDRMEFRWVMLLIVGMYTAIFLAILLMVFVSDHLGMGEGVSFLIAFISMGALFTVHQYTLHRTLLNLWCRGLLRQLRALIASDPAYRDALETAKKIDPAMARNTRRLLLAIE